MATEQGNRAPREEAKRHRAGNGGKSGSALSPESQRFIGACTSMASHWLGSQKSAIAQRLHDAALGLRNFSGNLDDRPNLREYVQAAADGIDTISEEVERRDLEDLARSAEDTIRRQPLAVFAGLLLTGLFIARMMRSDPQVDGFLDENARKASGD